MDRINARDLRVGNWVYYDPNVFIDDEYESTKEIEIAQIESGEDIDLIIENCFLPIPLTEEILIKNGFPEDEWHGSFPEDKNGLLYIVLSSNKIFWEFNDCRIELKSVHQLQNILQDLGIEKEIKV